MNRPFSLLVFGCILAAVASPAIPDPVRVDTGSLAGSRRQRSERPRFQGHPFAAPPVGDLRWRAPQPAAKWEGVRTADQFSPTCTTGAAGRGGGRWTGQGRRTQGESRSSESGSARRARTCRTRLRASEDCLYVNVWTAAKSASDRLPVIVWNYGGGFTGGSGSEARYDGEGWRKRARWW